MVHRLWLIGLVACASPPPRTGRRDADSAPPAEHPPIAPPEAGPPGAEPVDVTGLEATPYPGDPLGRALTVELAAAADAVVTCTLDRAPPLWREVLPIDSDWRWTNADPGPSFADPAFDDSAWTSSPAPFGREDDAATALPAAQPGADDAAWFRATFEVADPAPILSLEAAVRRDDGVVLWLNGVEVARDNVPAVLGIASDDERTLQRFDLDPALLVAGTNTLAAELRQAPGSTDLGFSVRLAGEVDELLPETHVVRSAAPAARHELALHGLLADASYTCEARAEPGGGASVSLGVTTDPLPLPIRLATLPGLEDPSAGYLLFNHSRSCAEDRSNRLFVVDPEGRVRWTHEIPIDAPSSIDLESRLLDDGTILWGGGADPAGVPQVVGLDGETVYRAAYAGIEGDEYHHDLDLTADGRIVGLVDGSVVDGGRRWVGFGLVEHDPATGEVTWRWDAQQAYDAGELPEPGPGDGDPWHANSMAVVDDADGPGVYVSLYYLHEIVRIDRATGAITWRLTRDFALEGDHWFSGIHAIDVFPGPNGDRLFVYDNGTDVDHSRALAFRLDAAARVATIDWQWTEPTWYEPHWGDADQTDRGTVLVTMSHASCRGASLDHLGAFVEVDEATGEVVSRLDFLDGEEETYRGQRIDGCALFANERYCPPAP